MRPRVDDEDDFNQFNATKNKMFASNIWIFLLGDTYDIWNWHNRKHRLLTGQYELKKT